LLRTPESESKEESGFYFTPEPESKGESDLLWTPESNGLQIQNQNQMDFVRFLAYANERTNIPRGHACIGES
jgi:hypothetical protein